MRARGPTGRRGAGMKAYRIRLVAWHVFKESVRDRVLYGIAAFALVLVAASLSSARSRRARTSRSSRTSGCRRSSSPAVLMTVFIGVGLVAREIDRRSIYGLLAKPLPRWEFIVGKYFGLVLTIVVNVAAMTGGALHHAGLAAGGPRRRTSGCRGTRRRSIPGCSSRCADPRRAGAAHGDRGVVLDVLVERAVVRRLHRSASSSRESRARTCVDFNDIVEAPAIGARRVGGRLDHPGVRPFDVKAQVVHGIRVPPASSLRRSPTPRCTSRWPSSRRGPVFSRREFK